ncbi:MAG: LysR family transcriptional regulator [Rhodobacteraceae bacterium]|nr:LysR family transcriptional regulator [Paracoccaceae bacterium]
MVNKNASLPPLDYLLAFESAAELGSFARASRTLNISESSVSRKVKLLEHHYGRSFFKRAERSVALTKHGHQFFKDIAPILDELRVISNRVQVENAVQTVTLAATHSVAGLWLMPRLARFNALNDDLKIKLLSSDNDEECLGEDVTLSILRGDGHWQGYDAREKSGHCKYRQSCAVFPDRCGQQAYGMDELANVAFHNAEEEDTCGSGCIAEHLSLID